MIKNYLTLSLLFFAFQAYSQEAPDPLGGWYTYNFDHQFSQTPWGLNGEVQYTGYEAISDLNWFLVRAGLTYQLPESKVKFALGYGHATFGVIGAEDAKVTENRIYQEVKIPSNLFGLTLNHRFRYEQRFFNGFFRSRIRYGLFLNIPLGSKQITAKTWYLALYNEFFVNGERKLRNGNEVTFFDQNRIYGALGYAFSKDFKLQLGAMRLIRSTDDRMTLQASLHHRF
ncbi:DUF2490 domain-containing protein [Gilvibacter sediminis]|uniref:DUF2490 domain-containing protein n=1 Tax=Gilvibacter sediminis TaxID=379071 RepID=UPI0023507FB4|nr:DUF2490 domain-containing protein [Gilvibacter sediminis]MDC7998897.1 DUF2490 domain-containing protein [Gilvibacter sediminis]